MNPYAYQYIHDKSNEETGAGTTQSNEYNIAVSQMPALLKQLERCKEKLGYKFEFENLGKTVVHQKHLVTNTPFTDWRTMIKPTWLDEKDIPCYRVRITSHIENTEWELVAIVDHIPTQTGNVITQMNPEYEIPKNYYLLDKIECDHCHTNRDRKSGAILYNKKLNEFRLVGSSCIVEYTGLDAGAIAALSDVASIIRTWAQGQIAPGNNHRSPTYIDVDEALAVAYVATKLFGYRKSSEQVEGRDWYRKVSGSTKEIVLSVLSNALGYNVEAFESDDSVDAKIISYIKEHAPEVNKAIQDIKEFITNLDNEGDDFKKSLQTVVSGDIIVVKQLGLLCCIPNMYLRLKQDEDVKTASKDFTPNNEYYGKIGERIVIDDIYKIVKGAKTKFGSYIVTILSKEGYEFTAFIDENYLPDNFDDVAEVKCEVYKFSEFRGKKSTTVKNVTFVTNQMKEVSDTTKFVGEVGSKITINVAKYDIGEVRTTRVAYNAFSDYAPIKIWDEEGNAILWNCPQADVYEGKVELKKVTATVKDHRENNDGSKCTVIGGRVKVNESKVVIDMDNTKLFESIREDALSDPLYKEYQSLIDEGIITEALSFETFKYYGAKNVRDFCELAEKGAFDNTATIADFIEYGAQNLNDINVLKHQGKLFPSVTAEQCFELGADAVLAASRKMFEEGAPEDASVYDYI